MSNSLTIQNIKKSREFFDKVFKPYAADLSGNLLPQKLYNPENYLQVLLCESHRIILRDFIQLIRAYNRFNGIKIKEYDYSLTMVLDITFYPYNYKNHHDFKLYINIMQDTDECIIELPYIQRLQLDYPPGGIIQNFNGPYQSIIYTEETINALLGCYTYEQLMEYLQTNAHNLLLPELWSIVYSYMFYVA